MAVSRRVPSNVKDFGVAPPTSSRLRPFRTSLIPFRVSSVRPRPGDQALVAAIRSKWESLIRNRDDELSQGVQRLKSEFQRGNLLDSSIVITSFALTAEAVRRAIGLEYYDVQFLAGIALATGAIAEMKTGEGKTIVAALPAALHALTGRGVHVATVNAYLADRDFQLLAPAYSLLGLTVSHLKDGGSTAEKRKAYEADVVYGTGYEFGFDYLRDQVIQRARSRPRLGGAFLAALRGENSSPRDSMQRELYFAIIDEIDSVLLDEASTPLIISSAASQTDDAAVLLKSAAELAERLQPEIHYLVRPRERTVTLTSLGQSAIFAENAPTTGLSRPWHVYVEQALRVRHLMRRDVDYVVRDGEIHLVDQYTGRIFTDRTWQDGLHQAIEYREGVAITAEKQATARISRQRFYGLYERLCGMTGTATGHEAEFREFYQLPVVVIPERVPCQRQHWPTQYFPDRSSKLAAIVDQASALAAAGRPVLIGTRTIQESTVLTQLLHIRGIPHHLLNGVQDADEAELISRAGQAGAITIATNMAGRGTDIPLSPAAAANGGLHVIATERQESSRVDRQLIGRAARQGDPGSCQFFVAADDEIVQQFLPDATDTIARQPSPVVHDVLISRIQQIAERYRYQQRVELHQHDRWLNDVLATVAERSES